MMSNGIQDEADAAVKSIVASPHEKKLVVAGPGTGKTFLFRRLLESFGTGDKARRLIFTFINTLKDDLKSSLGHLGMTFTFHGFCRYLLQRNPGLRSGLTETFRYYPGLVHLIPSDWKILRTDPIPQFVLRMREAFDCPETDFYLNRASYYDSISFDDSVFRVYKGVRKGGRSLLGSYDIVLVDEFQDFNRVEAQLIELLAESNRIVIVGDDDQALYTTFRGSSTEFIRRLYGDDNFGRFPLPFCMRCTEVIVDAVNDVILRAQASSLLKGRIAKPFRYYPPLKQADSLRYPGIKVVNISTQTKKLNYLGKYVAEQVARIPQSEIDQSHQDQFPTVLIIGPEQYRRQILQYLESTGYKCDGGDPREAIEPKREDGLRILHDDPASNLGWRIILETDAPSLKANIIRNSLNGAGLATLMPNELRESILAKVAQLEDKPAEETISPTASDATQPTIKLTSFEGSKGLSAQHVFIIGLHEGDLPKNSSNITDLEVCKFLVALTRTRKQCQLIYMSWWSGRKKRASPFINWINSHRKEVVRVNKEYWKRKAEA